MLCYLAGIEPYYLKCIRDGPFQPKTTGGDDKPESQWTPDERRVVVQDQCLKSIIMSCLTDDIMESVISYEAKATWTDLVHNFESPSDTKENMMDLKLEYQTFRAKPTKSLSQTYIHYKTLLNELANDGVNLSNMKSMLVSFVYEDNLIQRRYSDTKKALITTPLSTGISTAFFSNNVIQDFQENSDDEVDERSSHFTKDCFSKTSEPSYKSPVNGYSSVLKGFQPKFTPKLIQSSQNSISQADPKVQKDYKAEYKKMKAKLALVEANPSTSQTPKTFQPNNKGLVVETFDWDEEKVSDDVEVTQVKVLMALADDELIVGKNHDRNGEWIDITIRKCRDELLVLKQAKPDDVTFQIQNTKLTKLNHALQEQLKEEKKINEKWITSSKKVSQCISEQIPHQKKKVLGGELFTKTSSKMNENLFVPASMGRILVPESQAVNESLKLTETSNTPESSKDSEVESLTPLPPLKNLQGASSSSEVMPLIFQPYSLGKRPGLGIMKHTKPETQESLDNSVSGTVTVSETKPTTPSVPTEVKNTEQESKLNELTKLVQMLIDEKILKAKTKPFPPCTHCGFNDYRPDDYRNYPECEIYGSYDHFTSGHNRVIHIRGGILDESSQSSESSI
ncbi:hypothetical protein Tco_1380272, partial [Tanacetum coccineum]